MEAVSTLALVRGMRKSCLTLIWWLVAAAGFSAPLPGFVLAGQTAHFSFYSRGEKVDMPKVEKRVAELEKLFGQTLTGRADYYRYATAQEVAAGTGYYAAGVTLSAANEIHSTEPCHDHELVHLVTNRLGNPGAFFQEGLAVAVGNRGEWQGRSADKTAKANPVSVPELVAGFDRYEPSAAYAVAGSFVGYLVRTHGIEQVTKFFRTCGPKVNTSAAFASTFGGTLETVSADWRKSL
jgi:hypothetical protein